MHENPLGADGEVPPDEGLELPARVGALRDAGGHSGDQVGRGTETVKGWRSDTEWVEMRTVNYRTYGSGCDALYRPAPK